MYDVRGLAVTKGASMGDERVWRMTPKWVGTVVTTAILVGMLAAPGIAVAPPHPSDADFGYTYNAETQQIGFWFGASDEGVVCEWSDSAAVEPIPDLADDPVTECFVVDVAGPNGQVNHGSIVSAFVHGLHEVMELSGFVGPRGQFVSAVARSDDGKGSGKLNASSDAKSNGQGPPAFVEEKKASRGNKNKGNG